MALKDTFLEELEDLESFTATPNQRSLFKAWEEDTTTIGNAGFDYQRPFGDYSVTEDLTEAPARATLSTLHNTIGRGLWAFMDEALLALPSLGLKKGFGVEQFEEAEGFISEMGEFINLPSLGKLDKGTVTGAVGDFFGLRTFPSSTWATRDRRRQALAAEAGVSNWDELDPYRQRLLSEKDPELMELDLEVRRFNLERGDEMRLLQQELFDKTDQIRGQYIQSLNQYEMDWRDGKGTGENFRRAVDRLSIDLGARYDEVYSPSSRFAPALAELRGAQQRGNSAPIEQIARDEYVVRLIVGDEEMDHKGNKVTLEDAFGSFNYEERSRREEDMIARYGHTVFNNVKMYFDKTATLPPAVREFRELRDKFSSYWEVGDRLAQEIGIGDQWGIYKNTYGSFESDALQEEFPALKEILKEERAIRVAMRKQSPLLDAFLLRYGYITSPVNKEVLNAGKKAVQQYDANIQFNFPFAVS